MVNDKSLAINPPTLGNYFKGNNIGLEWNMTTHMIAITLTTSSPIILADFMKFYCATKV